MNAVSDVLNRNQKIKVKVLDILFCSDLYDRIFYFSKRFQYTANMYCKHKFGSEITRCVSVPFFFHFTFC